MEKVTNTITSIGESMKKIISFITMTTLFACNGSKTQPGHNNHQDPCICERTFTLEGRKVKSILKLDIE